MVNQSYEQCYILIGINLLDRVKQFLCVDLAEY